MEQRRLRVFSHWALSTTVATYLLIMVGALVRAAGAGLGCPDWPRCFGRWIPPVSVSQLPSEFDATQFNAVLTWTEYINRLLGVSIGLLIVATLVVAIRWHRDKPRLIWPSVAATLLVAYQGWLGGQVVLSGLTPWIITAHMLLALIIVTLLLYATFHARLQAAGLQRSTDPARRRLRYAVAVVGVMALLQIGIGTQVRGGMEHAVDLDPTLPRSEWLAQVASMDALHRGFAQAVFIGVLALGLWVRRRFANDRGLTRSATASVILVLSQLGLGVALTSLALPAVAQVLHLLVASTLLGALTLMALQSQREPSAP
jgi:cytochrome c oxidase assembly protein subunit 15